MASVMQQKPPATVPRDDLDSDSDLDENDKAILAAAEYTDSDDEEATGKPSAPASKPPGQAPKVPSFAYIDPNASNLLASSRASDMFARLSIHAREVAGGRVSDAAAEVAVSELEKQRQRTEEQLRQEEADAKMARMLQDAEREAIEMQRKRAASAAAHIQLQRKKQEEEDARLAAQLAASELEKRQHTAGLQVVEDHPRALSAHPLADEKQPTMVAMPGQQQVQSPKVQAFQSKIAVKSALNVIGGAGAGVPRVRAVSQLPRGASPASPPVDRRASHQPRPPEPAHHRGASSPVERAAVLDAVNVIGGAAKAAARPQQKNYYTPEELQDVELFDEPPPEAFLDDGDSHLYEHLHKRMEGILADERALLEAADNDPRQHKAIQEQFFHEKMVVMAQLPPKQQLRYLGGPSKELEKKIEKLKKQRLKEQKKKKRWWW